MSRDDKPKKKPPPSFSGNTLPVDINPMGLPDDFGEETTRRIAFQPSFEPVSSFEPPAYTASTKFAGVSKAAIGSAAGTLQHAVSKGIWTLKKVPPLPQFHPLERTAVFVPNAAPSEVSMRISDVLRQRSIEAIYDDDKAKVKCVTSEGVDFRVRLYRGRGKFDHGIIVEVQRRFGASNVFHEDTTAILDAAQDKVPPPPVLCSGNLPLISSEGNDDDDTEYPQSNCGSSSLKMIDQMLRHSGHDAQHLALQMLVSLTDASKMGVKTATATSIGLLQADNSNEVGTKVLSLILNEENDGEESVFKRRSMAFQVMANVFQTLQGDVPEYVMEKLRPVLLKELDHAEKTPRNALQAARVVEFLVPHDSGFNGSLQVALEAGVAHHAALQRQVKLCIDKGVH